MACCFIEWNIIFWKTKTYDSVPALRVESVLFNSKIPRLISYKFAGYDLFVNNSKYCKVTKPNLRKPNMYYLTNLFPSNKVLIKKKMICSNRKSCSDWKCSQCRIAWTIFPRKSWSSGRFSISDQDQRSRETVLPMGFRCGWVQFKLIGTCVRSVKYFSEFPPNRRAAPP